MMACILRCNTISKVEIPKSFTELARVPKSKKTQCGKNKAYEVEEDQRDRNVKTKEREEIRLWSLHLLRNMP